MKLKRFTLGTKLVVCSALILLVSIAVISLLVFFSANSMLQEKIQTDLNTRATDVARAIENKLENLKLQVEGIADDQSVRMVKWIGWDDLKLTLNSGKEKYGFANIGIADLEGKLKLIDDKTIDISNYDFFNSVIKGSTSISDPIDSNGQIVFALAAPVYEDRQIVGAIVAIHDNDVLTNIIKEVKEGRTGHAYIINQNGTIVAHPDQQKVVDQENIIESSKTNKDLQELAELHQKMINGESGLEEYRYDGRVHYLVYSPVTGTKLSLALTVPKNELISIVYTLLNEIVVSAVLLLAVSIVLTLFFMRLAVVKPVKSMVTVAESIANGDLNVYPEYVEGAKDEVCRLQNAIAVMTDKLNYLISEINQASEQVSMGAKQLSDSSMALSQGATEQASTIEELTASIEEMSYQIKSNAESAEKANQIATQSRDNATQGKQDMMDMLQAIGDINESSRNISKVIKVIDDIAFQTNILALNAAVEAARAGQYGRGFAVVAEEVRNLAIRSANAAKETSEMIEGSLNKAQIGAKIAQKTADSFNKIIDGFSNVADLVENISTSSSELAAGISQINQGLMQFSQVVQINSATSEEGAASSQELAGQAELLKQLVNRFKLRKAGKPRGVNTAHLAEEPALDIEPDQGKFELEYQEVNDDKPESIDLGDNSLSDF